MKKEILAGHVPAMNEKNEISLYVGTYEKYNMGSLEGAWLDLTTFDSAEEFLDFCRELHNDEKDPELMFQDYCVLPKHLYSECSLNKTIWEWLALDEHDREVVKEYWDEVSEGDGIDYILEAFAYEGDFSDYAANCADELMGCMSGSRGTEWLQRYFDYKKFERDFSYDYHISSHYVFYYN